ncbi:MAG: cell division protein ZapA [Rhodothermales bacterium]|nr:cell division protein ZapA [Rhodothermales bacterium]
MEKSIRVRILGREYGLRVDENDEKLTKDIAKYLDVKMRSFRDAHPDQQDVTTAVIAGLAVTEELFTHQNESREDKDRVSKALDEMSDLLDTVLYSRS